MAHVDRFGSWLALGTLLSISCVPGSPTVSNDEQQVEGDARAAPGRVPTRVTGILEVVFADDFANPGRSALQIHLRELDRAPDEPGARFELRLRGSSELPPVFQDGALVRVRGTRVDETLLEVDLSSGSSGESAVEPVALAPAAVGGAQRVIVLIGDSADQSVSCTNAAVQSLMFGSPTSVSAYYLETSSNTLELSGDVFGPFSVPTQNSGTCDTSAWASALEQAATAQGVNLSNYSRRVYVIPGGSCGFAGLGTVGGNPSRAWVTGACQIPDVYAHELGHNLGMHHASTPTSEYGDRSCVMGIGGVGLRHFNAPHQLQMGWLGGLEEVTSSGLFRVGGLETEDTPQAVHVPSPDNNDRYISYRLPLGMDATQLPSTYRNQVTVHSWPGGGARTTLLAVIPAGGSYFDATTGMTVTFESSDATAASVRASFGCVSRAPTLQLAPATQGGAAGSTQRYVATVANTEAIGCDPRTFDLAASPATDWVIALSQSTITLAPGASSSVDVDVTAPLSAAGATSFSIAVLADSVSVASQSATFVVDAAAPTAPTNLVATARRREITLTWQASTDDVGVTGYRVYRDGAQVATVATTAFGDRSFTAGQTYVYTVSAFDVSGNESALSNAATVTTARKGRR